MKSMLDYVKTTKVRCKIQFFEGLITQEAIQSKNQFLKFFNIEIEWC